MKLYLLTRKDDNRDFDQYHGAVIAAVDSRSAKKKMLAICSEGEQWKTTLISENIKSNVREGFILISYRNYDG